ncbi:MAG: sialate O-acetylesterase, partial [Chloroflexi bacterium]|nr:sialate O-acetylesterase [Chloroflexota bacterium]
MENLDNNFHLYLLIGQSNMAGRGALAAEDQQTHPRVFSLDKAGNWVPAADPIHFDKPGAAVGPGLTFGKTMAGLYPTARIGLIPCAVGGSHIMVWKEGVFWDVMNCAPYD